MLWSIHINIFTRSVSAKEKNLCFIVYTTLSPTESPSVKSELRVSVQPAKSASTFRLLCEELPKVYVFSLHNIFTTFLCSFSE